MLKFASICPHPPIIIPTIGKPPDSEKVSNTIEAMEKLAEDFSRSKTETAIVISPHGPLDSDEITISKSPTFTGNFYHFGDFNTEFAFRNNLDLVKKIEKAAKKANVPIKPTNIKNLDHGALVPLYYLTQGKPDIKIVTLTFSFLDSKTHFKFGNVLNSIIQDSKEKIAIIASGDLSHRLIPGAPAGFSPKAKDFDEAIIELLKKKNVKGILNFDKKLIEEAGECGYRSIVILLGAIESLNWEPEILSYEAPFGVGYMVVNFKFI